jgi:hypothetical protein
MERELELKIKILCYNNEEWERKERKEHVEK